MKQDQSRESQGNSNGHVAAEFADVIGLAEKYELDDRFRA